MAYQLQQAFLSAILCPEPLPFQTLIAHLMSHSNVQRSRAESVYNFIKKNYPNQLAMKLVNHVSSAKVVESCCMSAVLLRKCVTKGMGESFIWFKLDELTQASVKVMLLRCIQVEESKSVVKKLCDAVSELASSILPVNGWPELLPFLFRCATSDYVKLQELSFLIFFRLAGNVGEVLIRVGKVLHSVFLKTLSNSPNLDVKIAAFSAVVKFVRCLASLSDREKFQEVLPLMMRTLTEALNCGQEATAQEALELLIELAETNLSFFRKQIEDVVGSMLQIAEADCLEEGTRHLAIL
ncbi:hypothetical protein P3S67_006001 [Capsicum chacoense]